MGRGCAAGCATFVGDDGRSTASGAPANHLAAARSPRYAAIQAEGIPLIGQFFGHLGKFKRNTGYFLDVDVVDVFFGLVPQPIARFRQVTFLDLQSGA